VDFQLKNEEKARKSSKNFKKNQNISKKIKKNQKKSLQTNAEVPLVK